MLEKPMVKEILATLSQVSIPICFKPLKYAILEAIGTRKVIEQVVAIGMC